MRPSNIIINVFLILITYACASGQKEAKQDHPENDQDYFEQMEQQLVGKWKNEAFEVDVHTYNNSDTSFTVRIDQYNWDLKMEVQPFITHLKDDGSYTGTQKDNNGNIIANPKGMWMLDGDTLILEDNKDNIYKYKVLIEEEYATFKSRIDYDDDGKKDDLYEGTQKKINNQ